MSDEKVGQAHQRKPSTNKNIKKLRTISMVCSLTNGWQQWATDNEKKQASEPRGWTPSSIGGPMEEPIKKWVPKKNAPTQSQPTDASKNHIICSGDAKKKFTPRMKIQDAPKTAVHNLSEASIRSPIKVKQGVTVTIGVQEKSAGISMLAEKMKRDSLPLDNEIDRLLKKKGSPTRRRKCSNMVSSLTKSWKQLENQQHLGEKGGVGLEEGLTCVVDNDNSGEDELEKLEEKETERRDSEEDAESAAKIKRPTLSM